MGEPAEAPRPVSERTTCLYCGADLGSFPSAVKGLCIACSARVIPQSPRSDPRQPQSGAKPPRQPYMPRLARSHEALAELVARGPVSEAPKMVRELQAAEKRISSLTAFIPFVGPLLIQRSDAHSQREKRILTWLSILLTSLGLAGLVAMLPTPATELTRLEQRITNEMDALGSFAEQFRSEHGNYPTPAMWQHFAERADPRFYDPWARPYRYEPHGGSFTLRTLGGDGIEGGSDEDADVTATFPPAAR